MDCRIPAIPMAPYRLLQIARLKLELVLNGHLIIKVQYKTIKLNYTNRESKRYCQCQQQLFVYAYSSTSKRYTTNSIHIKMSILTLPSTCIESQVCYDLSVYDEKRMHSHLPDLQCLFKAKLIFIYNKALQLEDQLEEGDDQELLFRFLYPMAQTADSIRRMQVCLNCHQYRKEANQLRHHVWCLLGTVKNQHQRPERRYFYNQTIKKLLEFRKVDCLCPFV